MGSQVPEINRDPEWAELIVSMQPVVEAIAHKRTSDNHLAEDVVQEALLAMLTIIPEEDIDAYQDWHGGEITEDKYKSIRDAYLRQVANLTILSCLDSMKTGPWGVGRTRRRVNPHTREREKVQVPPRYTSLESLVEDHGLQIDEHGELSWPEVSTDGLDMHHSEGR